MSDSICSLVRINATNNTTDDWSGVENETIYNKVKELITSTATAGMVQSGSQDSDVVMVEGINLNFWATDGTKRAFRVYCDEEGKSKGLPPNHRVNAMVDAARFISNSFDCVYRSRNQELKDTYGSNYFVGDVYFEIPTGYPTPDLAIFGDNPIDFIMQTRKPSDQMRRAYGAEVARNMISPLMKKNLPSYFGGNLEQMAEMLNNLEWVTVTYDITTGGFTGDSYQALLRSWGY